MYQVLSQFLSVCLGIKGCINLNVLIACGAKDDNPVNCVGGRDYTRAAGSQSRLLLPKEL